MPRRWLGWSLLVVLVAWLGTTAAHQAAGVLPLPSQEGGLFAGIGIGLGTAAAGIGWAYRLFAEGKGGSDPGNGLRDLVVEMRAEARADREVMRRSVDQLAGVLERVSDTLGGVEQAMHSNAAGVAAALQSVKENSSQLAAGIRQAIRESEQRPS